MNNAVCSNRENDYIKMVCMERVLDFQFVTLQFPSNLAAFEIAVDRSVTLTVGLGQDCVTNASYKASSQM